MRRRTDRLHPRPLGPREREALRLVEERPGITVAQLAEEMDVSMQRAWQYVNRLEAGVCGWNRKRIGSATTLRIAVRGRRRPRRGRVVNPSSGRCQLEGPGQSFLKTFGDGAAASFCFDMGQRARER